MRSKGARLRRRVASQIRAPERGNAHPGSEEDAVTIVGMTKAELVEEVARKTALPKKQAEIIVNTVFESIVDSLKSGEKIELRGFGSFRIRQRDSRIGRNPKTGQKVDVPSKRIPYFKPGKELRELLNHGE
jgi:integration host factor subunit beta